MSKPIIEIKGFRELQEKIKILSNDKDKKKEMLLILRQVANPTVRAAKGFVNNSRKPHLSSGKRTKQLINPGALRNSIGTITGKAYNPTILVGPRVKGSFGGWYGHFVHEGHEIFNQRTSTYTRNLKGRFLTNKVTGALTAKKALKKGIKSQGRTKSNPFMKKAAIATNLQVTADAEKKITIFIQRRINKLSTFK
jgi:hypothetical protein